MCGTRKQWGSNNPSDGLLNKWHSNIWVSIRGGKKNLSAKYKREKINFRLIKNFKKKVVL